MPKGIAHRLSAFELFLQTQPDWRGKVTYLQIAPKSRTEIPEYADMEQEIGSAAGRINGAYGEADWTPIRYVNRAYSHSTLAGLYRAACVRLVTPLRDGMNLVAQGICRCVNGTLNLTRVDRYRHFEPDPSASSLLCPLAGTIGSQTLSSFMSLVLVGRAIMPARRLSLSR